MMPFLPCHRDYDQTMVCNSVPWTLDITSINSLNVPNIVATTNFIQLLVIALFCLNQLSHIWSILIIVARRTCPPKKLPQPIVKFVGLIPYCNCVLFNAVQESVNMLNTRKNLAIYLVYGSIEVCVEHRSCCFMYVIHFLVCIESHKVYLLLRYLI